MNIRQVLNYAIGPIGSGLLGLISLPIITWVFNVEDVGRISMLQVFISLAVLLFGLGLDQSYVREYYGEKNKPFLLKNAIYPTFLIFLIFTFLVISIDIRILSKILFDISSLYLSLIILICFISALLIRYFSLILRLQNKALAFSMSQLLPKILVLVFVLLVAISSIDKNADLLLSINCFALFIGAIIYGWNTRNSWIPCINEKLDIEKIKSLLHYGMPLFFGGFAVLGLNFIDRISLRYYSNYIELGVYSVAMTLATGVTILASIFNTIWAPTLLKWESENRVELKKIVEISSMLFACIYFIIVFVALFSWVIPYFLPTDYIKIKFIIMACILGPLFYTLSEVTSIGIVLTRKIRFSLYASLLAVINNIVLCIILVPKLGSSGAAISTSISFWLFFVLKTSFSNMVWKHLPSIKYFILSMMLLVATIAQCYFQSTSIYYYIIWLSFLLLGLLFFKTYLIQLLSLIKFYVIKK
ncbi:oligosaccharide flippase family protein [Acinetobacter sp. SM34]|uniref:lipopolysaccharide biosynthesis protein n=1 Tax=Acinetobacter sp. SM34 TaxID=1301620 RepID=UPI001EDB4F2A|nr:oligosaccharide flippase family protein [Acinetobacter sp. SM34]MCG2608680.1 oligosaccharide flippase family protein [Acinetobacter sp. SM34]